MKLGRILAALAVALAIAVPAAAQAPLRVGSTPTGVPFTFLDTRTNTIQGIMVDLIGAIGKDQGFAVQVEPLQFSTLIPALTANKIDIIAAAMFITPPRQEVVDFSTPIVTYGEALIVPAKDGRAYATLEDLKGLTVGAQVGTAFVDPLKRSGLFPAVRIYDTIPDILRDVNVGRIGAGFADFPIVAYNLQQGLYPGVRLVREYKPQIPGSVGIAVRKADRPLLDRINASLAKFQEDGTLRQILAKWGQ